MNPQQDQLSEMSEETRQEAQAGGGEAMYRDQWQHLGDELLLHDLRLLLAFHERRVLLADDTGAGTGFFISEAEVLGLLNLRVAPSVQPGADQEQATLAQLLVDHEERLHRKTAASQRAGIRLPLVQLQKVLGLDRFEMGVVVTALALDCDKKYERIYAFFNDDLNKKAPSMELALNLFGGGQENRLALAGYFAPHNPLLSFGLVQLVSGHEEEGCLSARFRLDLGLKALLMGEESLHPALLRVAVLEYPASEAQLSGAKRKLQEEIRGILTSAMESEAKGMVFWLHGNATIEKKEMVAGLAHDLMIPMLTADLEDVAAEPDPAATLTLLARQAIIRSALLFFSSGELLGAEEERGRSLRRLVLKTMREYPWFIFVDAQDLWTPDDAGETLDWYPMELGAPDYYERRKMWAELLAGQPVEGSDLDAVASRFSFSESQIRRAAGYARLTAREEKLDLPLLSRACSLQSSRRLSRYSRRVVPRHLWDDLVLPADKLLHLREICGFLKNKHQVYFEWGFDKKLALGRGLNILFTGPSGTGKTMTAEIIAAELHLDLYKVDLSAVVSKYIGETEKNLNRIFAETATGNAILFFDEADALFGKRSEVKDAHDRYANIETNYLLQKMEEHENVIILSTNLGKNMDEAFLRRMHFTVDFPFPDEKHRALMWQKIFPENAPLAATIDYRYMSRKLKVTGGNIKNIALASAFLAAEETASIDMKHILAAARREYQKIGKPFVKSDFAPYSELLEQGEIDG